MYVGRLPLCLTPSDAPEKIPYAVKRYTNETKRLLGIYNTRLEGRDWLVGGKYSYADMCTLPWVRWVRCSSREPADSMSARMGRRRLARRLPERRSLA